MTTSASRQARSARNAIAEALGLGETYPLADLPVSAEPPVVAFGLVAQIGIQDSERTVVYRLLNQDAQPLPNGAKPEAQGSGSTIAIETPAIAEDITFTVHAVRPNGREAMLSGTGEIRVGLDDSLSAAVVPAGAVPIVIDHGATVDVEVANSQEGVTYRLVARPAGDTAPPDDAAAMTADISLSPAAGTPGTGAAIRLTSIPLLDDTVVCVRAVKTFGGNKPTQTTLLKMKIPVFVRPDSTLAVAAKPVIVDYGGKAAIRIGAAAQGVSYTVHGKAVADREFSRLDPPDPATLAIPTPDDLVHVVTPVSSIAWEEPPGFQKLGDPAVGAGAALSLPLPELHADTMVVVEARKSHGAGPESFTSAERLDQLAAVLVRPNPKPPLRLAAVVTDGKMTQLTAVGGQPGIFYSVSAAAPLGQLYLHQPDPDDPMLNKGVGALAVNVDFVVAAGTPPAATSIGPPPLPRLDIDPVALPVEIKIQARRAMTGLTADLGKAVVAPLPKAEVQPPAVAAGQSAKVVIAEPVAGELYAVALDGRLVADPVKGAAAPLSLDTGPLTPGMRVELGATAGEGDAPIQVERLAPLAVTIG